VIALLQVIYSAPSALIAFEILEPTPWRTWLLTIGPSDLRPCHSDLRVI